MKLNYRVFGLMVLILNAFCLSSQTTLDEIIGDMNLPHEGRPHGVSDQYNWAISPRRGAVEPPADWTAAIAWGQLYEYILGNPATNTRVQFKDMELYYLSKKDGKWHRLQNASRLAGAAYREDFAGDDNIPADIRQESDGTISVTCGNGRNFHFWPLSGRVSIPKNEVAGCFVTLKARLILDNPLGNDDRDSARYVLSVGGDWWQSLSAQWDNWTTNADMGIGRFRFVTPEWRSYNMYSVSDSTLRNNPPPFAQLNTSIGGNPIALSPSLRFLPGYPNPANSMAHFKFWIAAPGNVKLSLYDSSGKSRIVIFQNYCEPGFHEVDWDASQTSSGVYMAKLTYGSEIQVRSFIILHP